MVTDVLMKKQGKKSFASEPASHSATIQLDKINLSEYQLVKGDYKVLSETEYELAPYTILIAQRN